MSDDCNCRAKICPIRYIRSVSESGGCLVVGSKGGYVYISKVGTVYVGGRGSSVGLGAWYAHTLSLISAFLKTVAGEEAV